MTVTTTANSISYAGNGTTTAFPFPYVFFEPTDLVVTLSGESPVLNSAGTYGYTVTGVVTDGEYASGGTVTFNTAPPADRTVSVVRAVPATQEVALVDNSKFPAATVNVEFDKLTVLLQQIEADLDGVHDELEDLDHRVDILENQTPANFKFSRMDFVLDYGGTMQDSVDPNSSINQQNNLAMDKYIADCAALGATGNSLGPLHFPAGRASFSKAFIVPQTATGFGLIGQGQGETSDRFVTQLVLRAELMHQNWFTVGNAWLGPFTGLQVRDISIRLDQHNRLVINAGDATYDSGTGFISYRTPVPHGFVASDMITGYGFADYGYSGSKVVVDGSDPLVVVCRSADPGIAVSTDVGRIQPLAYARHTVTVDAAFWTSNGSITCRTTAKHHFAIGNRVILRNLLPDAYNGTWEVFPYEPDAVDDPTGRKTATRFTLRQMYNTPIPNPGAASSTGTGKAAPLGDIGRFGTLAAPDFGSGFAFLVCRAGPALWENLSAENAYGILRHLGGANVQFRNINTGATTGPLGSLVYGGSSGMGWALNLVSGFNALTSGTPSFADNLPPDLQPAGVLCLGNTDGDWMLQAGFSSRWGVRMESMRSYRLLAITSGTHAADVITLTGEFLTVRVDDIVEVAGCTPASYNGLFTVASKPNATSVTFDQIGSAAPMSVLGTLEDERTDGGGPQYWRRGAGSDSTHGTTLYCNTVGGGYHFHNIHALGGLADSGRGGSVIGAYFGPMVTSARMTDCFHWVYSKEGVRADCKTLITSMPAATRNSAGKWDITTATHAADVMTFYTYNDLFLALQPGDLVHVTGCDPVSYNGDRTVSYVSEDKRTIRCTVSGSSAAITCPRVSSNSLLWKLASGSWSASVVTLSTIDLKLGFRGLVVGAKVLAEGCTPVAYNGWMTVLTISLDRTTITLSRDKAGDPTTAAPLDVAAGIAGFVDIEGIYSGLKFGRTCQRFVIDSGEIGRHETYDGKQKYGLDLTDFIGEGSVSGGDFRGNVVAPISHPWKARGADTVEGWGALYPPQPTDNYIDNAAGVVNQRAFDTSGATGMAADVYCVDRWRGGATGAASFSVSQGLWTLNGSLRQRIETNLASKLVVFSVEDLTGGDLSISLGATATGTVFAQPPTPGSSPWNDSTGLHACTLQLGAGDTNITPPGLLLNITAPAPTPRTVGITLGSPAQFVSANHGLQIGWRVLLTTTGTLYTGLLPNTVYYVRAPFSISTFRVSLTPDGPLINTSGSESGVHSVTPIISFANPRLQLGMVPYRSPLRGVAMELDACRQVYERQQPNTASSTLCLGRQVSTVLIDSFPFWQSKRRTPTAVNVLGTLATDWRIGVLATTLTPTAVTPGLIGRTGCRLQWTVAGAAGADASCNVRVANASAILEIDAQ